MQSADSTSKKCCVHEHIQDYSTSYFAYSRSKKLIKMEKKNFIDWNKTLQIGTKGTFASEIRTIITPKNGTKPYKLTHLY